MKNILCAVVTFVSGLLFALLIANYDHMITGAIGIVGVLLGGIITFGFNWFLSKCNKEEKYIYKTRKMYYCSLISNIILF